MYNGNFIKMTCFPISRFFTGMLFIYSQITSSSIHSHLSQSHLIPSIPNRSISFHPFASHSIHSHSCSHSNSHSHFHSLHSHSQSHFHSLHSHSRYHIHSNHNPMWSNVWQFVMMFDVSNLACKAGHRSYSRLEIILRAPHRLYVSLVK